MKKIIIIILLFLSSTTTVFASDIESNTHTNHNHKDTLGLQQQEATYSCPMHPNVTSHEKGSCPICGMFLVLEEPKVLDNKIIDNKKIDQQEAIYSCPMHPNVTSHEKGSCPICGMDLVINQQVKLPSNNAIQEHHIKTQNFNIKKEVVSYQTITPKLSTFGVIKYNEDNIFKLHSRYTGWIKETNSLKVGDLIIKGQLLYTIYSLELISAQQDFLLALDNSASNSELAKFRLKALGIQDQVITSIKKNKHIIENIPVYSELDGLITSLSINKGSYIEPKTTLITTVNPKELWIEGVLFDNDYLWADKGNAISVHMDFLKQDILTTIDYIYPEIDPITQGIKFRGSINNINHYIKKNQNLNITVSSAPISGIIIPYSSLLQTEKNNQVIIEKNNLYEIRDVTLGYIDTINANVIVTKGLVAGENIVTSGQFLIDAEASIQGSRKRLNGDKI